MECEGYQLAAERRAHGAPDLDDGAARGLDEHVATCAGCRAYVASIEAGQALREKTRAWATRVDYTDIAERVMRWEARSRRIPLRIAIAVGILAAAGLLTSRSIFLLWAAGCAIVGLVHWLARRWRAFRTARIADERRALLYVYRQRLRWQVASTALAIPLSIGFAVYWFANADRLGAYSLFVGSSFALLAFNWCFWLLPLWREMRHAAVDGGARDDIA